MISLEVFKQLTKITYNLERMIRLEVFKQLIKITYTLERMREDDQIRSIQTIDQVHVHPGEDERG